MSVEEVLSHKKMPVYTYEIVKTYPQSTYNYTEGIFMHGDHLYHLTYKSNTGFVYDRETFELESEFHYPYQGWGMTTDGKYLIMSNVSSAILFVDHDTLLEKKYFFVKDGESEVGFLNELEYIKGEIYANLWQSTLIARISPETGMVTGWIDLTGINPDPEKLKYPYVLNGIAYLEEEDLLLVTGKCWPDIYAIRPVAR